MPVSDIYTARSGTFSTGTLTTAQPFLSVVEPATKRGWITGIRIDVGVTAAVAGNSLLFQLARTSTVWTGGTALSGANLPAPHDLSAPACFATGYIPSYTTAPTVTTVLWEQMLPMTTGAAWEEFPPGGYEWQIPNIAAGSANAGVHVFVTQSVGTSTPVYADLIFSE
jgi:hypothetical protein